MNSHNEKEEKSPKENASWISKLFFCWFEPLVFHNIKNPLESPNNVPISPQSINVELNADKFYKKWNAYVQEKGVNFSEKKEGDFVTLWKPLFDSFGRKFVLGNVIGLVHYTCIFITPYLLKFLIEYINDDNHEKWKGYVLASGLLICGIFNTMTFNHFIAILVEVASQVRSSLISMIFHKTLKLSNSAKVDYTSGEITNFVSVDVQRLLDGIPYLGVLWSAPYQIVVALILLYIELGVASLIGGAALLLLLLPPNLIGGKFVEKIQRKQLIAKDLRIKLMNEIISGIKAIKLYSWEIPFLKKIHTVRNKEIKCLKLNAILQAVLGFTFSMSPFLVTIGCFSAYVFMSPSTNVLTPQKMFFCISLFNMMRTPMILYMMVFKDAITMMVSMRRITQFLNAEELADPPSGAQPENEIGDRKTVISISDGNFAWNDANKIDLEGLNLKVTEGSLIAIVGSVGSGKSSVLQAILGEMKRVSGKIECSSNIAYVPQMPWIQNLTVCQNILFNSEFDIDRYNQVLEACALKDDLKLFVKGDQTEIGENGINLSGGQKQRISLARAIYAKKDVYLLDDPLSAVDAHVGRQIFNSVICNDGMLRDKTRIWVTNQVAYIPQVDYVLVLKDGIVIEEGRPQELLENTESDLLKFITEQTHASSTRNDEKTSEIPKVENTLKNTLNEGESEPLLDSDGKLIDEEKVLTSHFPVYIMKDFIRNMGCGFFIAFFAALIIEQALHAGGIVWLSKWSDEALKNTTTANSDAGYKLGIYSALSAGEAIVQFIRDYGFYFKCAVLSRVIHEKLLTGVTRSPMNFFDTNPSGRIVNRFSADVDIMDGQIPRQLLESLWCMIEVLTTFVIVSISIPKFLIVAFPLLIVFAIFQRIYMITSRQLKRLYSITKSPIFSHFSETVQGSPIIRAFGKREAFIREAEKRLQINVACHYLSAMSNRWLSARIENIANVMIFFTAIFAIVEKDSISPGIAALAITYAVNVTGGVVWMVRMASELESNCVAIERIFEYANLESEDWKSEKESSAELLSWVKDGNIQFRNYHTRYREGLQNVLKNVNLTIDSCEKLGIVGRTGAGKSSFVQSLFRIIEATDGSIIIDENDISELPLKNLRSNLSIIPQDPVLFTGSLRFNLDPSEQIADEQMYSALELSQICDRNLDKEVLENGSNFSVGERQQVCLARALLRRPKILVLDEASAYIDNQTDEIIQKTIRNEFQNCTIITIAHRINTIMDYDRVILFSQGEVVEQGPPQELMNNPESHFYAMAKQAANIM